jgi:uncharacterized protein YdhG (YjbR/CyaY superfamily)
MTTATANAPNNEARQAYLEQASERFRTAYSEVERLVRARFPNAEATFEWSMPGWKAPREHVPEARVGTIDPAYVWIFLVDRKAGITLHFWNPADYYFLDQHKAALQQAGFKVMRGCLQFNRKGAYPVAAVERLLAAIE